LTFPLEFHMVEMLKIYKREASENGHLCFWTSPIFAHGSRSPQGPEWFL
jgi:hypothetical protein